MILSDIVKFKNLIDSMDVDPQAADAIRHLESLVYYVSNSQVRLESDIHNLMKDFGFVKKTIGSFTQSFANVSQSLQLMIEQQDQYLYDQSERLYKDILPSESVEHILGRKLPIDQDSENIMRARVKQHGDWRVPGMIIRPGIESHVDDMVALDPLYLVDSNIDLLEPAKQRYLPEYQRRLRLYTINDYAENPIFKKFPANQFGLIFAYNYFNFKPLPVISVYLEEIFQLLRPGGILTFTYNNCDQGHCVAFAEKDQMCYTPGNKLKKIAQQHGYIVNFECDGMLDAKWIELQKPGELTSIRGGQSLAKIVAG